MRGSNSGIGIPPVAAVKDTRMEGGYPTQRALQKAELGHIRNLDGLRVFMGQIKDRSKASVFLEHRAISIFRLASLCPTSHS